MQNTRSGIETMEMQTEFEIKSISTSTDKNASEKVQNNVVEYIPLYVQRKQIEN